MAFIILIPVNYALTGYETVTQASPNYRPIEHHWYDAFAKKSPEAPCDSYKFTVGDSFITNPGIFTYHMAYIFGGNTTSSAVDYTGQTLEECDVVYMSTTADARSQSSTISAYIACKSEAKFPVVFTTSFRFDASVTADWLLSPVAFKEVDGPISQNILFLDVDEAMASAGSDLVDQATNALQVASSNSGPLLVSAEALPIGGYPPWWCTPSLFNRNSTCGTAVPPVLNALSTKLYGATGNPIVNATPPTNYTITINNAMQTILAAIRIDLGNIFPNNFLVYRNPDVIGRTISSTIPIQGFTTPISHLYQLIGNGDGWLQGHEGLGTLTPDSAPPSQITLEYQCQVKQRRSAGSIFVNVTVATLTLFNNGWTAVTALLIFLALLHRKEEKKSCAGHDALEARIRALENQESLTESDDPGAEVQNLEPQTGEQPIAGSDDPGAEVQNIEPQTGEQPIAGSDDPEPKVRAPERPAYEKPLLGSNISEGQSSIPTLPR
ncbi:hypothetical protein FRB94_011583 [Tulasnella sp. JGI-2019a]|nr:hypothetical protein FRB93_000657 [Tulasnella sp. JGI-2019a]KAG9009727.1 hypothetical protein FRB94_011583 [Tulasnella sp. JGI-2019a]